jgi:hypothetical protein
LCRRCKRCWMSARHEAVCRCDTACLYTAGMLKANLKESESPPGVDTASSVYRHGGVAAAWDLSDQLLYCWPSELARVEVPKEAVQLTRCRCRRRWWWRRRRPAGTAFSL